MRLLFLNRVGCGVHGLLACWLTRRSHNTGIAWTLYDVGLDFRHCSLDLERVLDADDLVHAVAQSCHLLAALVQDVLSEAVLDHGVVVVFPLIFHA